MKTEIRRQMIIHPKVMDLLNDQISMEMQASASYLAMASWCDQRGLNNSTAFFYAQAAEERDHAMKIFKFINDNGGAAISPSVTNVKHEFESLRDVFEKSLDQEVKVTAAIFNIFKNTRALNDYTSELFMQWFVTEQAEEEETIRDILDVFDLMGDMPLKMIDERLPTE